MQKGKINLPKKGEQKYGPPLTGEEAAELNELIAEFSKDDSKISDIGAADGLMTGFNLYPEEIPAREWMGLLFRDYKDEVSKEGVKQKRLRKLLLRRYEDIGRQLKNSEIFEPYYTADEDEEVMTVEQQIDSLYPFIDVFLDVIADPLFNEPDGNITWGGLTFILSIFPELWDEKYVGPEGIDLLKKGHEVLETREDVLLQLASGIAYMAFGLKDYPVNPLLDAIEYGEEDSSRKIT